MRIIIVGGGPLGVNLAHILVRDRHEVIIIEKDPDKAREIAETLDCTVIQAEGTRPDILEKAEIGKADAVVAVTTYDQDNIIIGLIARTFSVREIIIRTDDARFLTVAKQLGFRHVVNPPQTTSAIISDVLRGVDTIELSTLVRGDVRFMTVIVGEKQEGKRLTDLEPPGKTEYIGLYRGETFHFRGENPVLKAGDEVLVITTEEKGEQIVRLFQGEESNLPV
jgi:trk system potassium uptake protein TrkA